MEGRKRPAAPVSPGESSKRERQAETTRDRAVTAPSHLLAQPSSSMLDSWLQEDIRPGGAGPAVLKCIPEGLQVLVPMMLDGAGVISLCQKVRGTSGAAVVALVGRRAAEDGARRQRTARHGAPGEVHTHP